VKTLEKTRENGAIVNSSFLPAQPLIPTFPNGPFDFQPTFPIWRSFREPASGIRKKWPPDSGE
jgi:hypothetical protein